MTNQEPHKIFNEQAQRLALVRAVRRQAKTGRSFLMVRAIEDLASRLSDVSRQFSRAVLIGGEDLREDILAALPPAKHPEQFDYLVTPAEISTRYDLIINVLELQSVDAVLDYLNPMRAALNPDGLMLIASFGGQSLTELRQSLYAADQAMLGGVSARVYPYMDHQQAAGLLSAMGLALPVVDIDRFTVAYSSLDGLISDLRDLGLTNTLAARAASRLPKLYKDKLTEVYAQSFSRADGKLRASFAILWLTGWAPHESQQKPLKPGSAKMRLADAFKTTETKL